MIELLVVIAIIAILASLLLPALGKGKQKAQGIECLSNHRQLTLAWRMYAEDNEERFPGPRSWLTGSVNFDGFNLSNWDPEQDIKKSPLWPYCGGSVGIFKCPADRSTVTYKGRALPRIRSMSLNVWMCGTDWTSSGDGPYVMFIKTSDIRNPSKAIVFLDEREDSLNDGLFNIGMRGYPDKPKEWEILDYPASYHNRAGGFSFADGHSEIKKWLDGRTTPQLRKGQEIPLGVPSPDNPDVFWLMDRATSPNR